MKVKIKICLLYTSKEAIQKTSKKLGEIEDKYLKDTNIYYSIIPDKSYFLVSYSLHLIDCNLADGDYVLIPEQ